MQYSLLELLDSRSNLTPETKIKRKQMHMCSAHVSDFDARFFRLHYDADIQRLGSCPQLLVGKPQSRG